jgi:hypothetical protein
VRSREVPAIEVGAEIIDLVQLPSGARPTPFAELSYLEVPRARAMDCDTYHDCLSLAARVHWVGFHCRQCPKYVPNARILNAPAVDPDDDERPDAAIIRLRSR